MNLVTVVQPIIMIYSGYQQVEWSLEKIFLLEWYCLFKIIPELIKNEEIVALFENELLILKWGMCYSKRSSDIFYRTKRFCEI